MAVVGPDENPPPPPSPPSFPLGKFDFRSGSAGPVVIRPNQIIVDNTVDVSSILEPLLSDIRELGLRQVEGEAVEATRELNTSIVYELNPALDVFVVLRRLRDLGVRASPNHVYFVTTRSTRTAGFGARNFFAPNYVAPNYVAPNYVAPNYVAPNYVAPNYVAPNYVAPNYVAPNYVAAGGGGCCPCPTGIDPDDTIPTHSARPFPDCIAPEGPDGAVVEDPVADIHIIDVARPGPGRTRKFETGELPDLPAVGDTARDVNNDGWLDPATNHGDFIESVIFLRSGIRATVWEATDPLGAIDDVHLIRALQHVDANSKTEQPRVLNLSLAGYTDDDQPNPDLADQIELMIANGWLIAAAAGNNASCRLAYPAVLPGVVSVSAYGRYGGPTWFSNYGPWVDACAPGEDIVAAFPDLSNPALIVHKNDDGTTVTSDIFDTGWALWSGTSFATPFVVARLASHLQNNPPAGQAATDIKTAIDAAIVAVLDDDDQPFHPLYGRFIE